MATASDVLRQYSVGQRTFQNLDLRGQDFSNQDLSESDFSGSDLRGASFRNATLRNANFRGVSGGVRKRAMVAMAIFYFLITIAIPTFYSLISLTFTNGPSIFMRTFLMNVFLAFSLIAVRFQFFHAARIFVVYGIDAVVFAFASILFFLYCARISDPSHTHLSLNWALPRTALFAAFVAIPIALFIERLCIKLDGGRSCWTGMWKWFGTDFRGAVLTDADFSGACLRGMDFRGSVLMHTCFYNAKDIELAEFGTASHRVIKNDLARKNSHRFSLYEQKLIRLIVTQETLEGINLSNLSLTLLHLRGMNFRSANLNSCQFSLALLENADFSDASLRKADFHDAFCQNAIFCNSDLYEAVLVNAQLEGADLRSASCKLANLEGAELLGVRVNYETCQKSEWPPERLVELMARGVVVSPLDWAGFPAEFRDRMRADSGLLLSFSTLLSDVDRAVISTLLYTTLGASTDCRVAEYREQEGMALVLIKGSRRQDLEQVAEALYARIWRRAEGVYREKQAADPAGYAELLRMLEELRSRLESMELRWGPGTGAPAPEAPAISARWGPAQRQLPASARPGEPVRMVILFAPKDQRYVDELTQRLVPLMNEGLLDCWHQGHVLPGDDLHAEWERQLAQAQVAVCMVSPALLASRSFIDRELTAAADRYHQGRFQIIPVLIRPTDLAHSFFAQNHIQPLPSNGRPVNTWRNRDEAWIDIQSGMRRVIIAIREASFLPELGEDYRRCGDLPPGEAPPA